MRARTPVASTNATPPERPIDRERRRASPSDLDLTSRPFPDALPAWMVRAVLGVRSTLRRVADRLAPADLVMFERSTGMMLTQAIGAVARADIAERIGDEAWTASEIA